jgi:ABC-type transporter Mla maintaining outer membrane lipid asymmetry ATPase subunit MlaF
MPTPTDAPVIELSGIVKTYGALRPLRIQQFALAAGECAAITGFDQPAAETLINLLTGATLADAGEVRVFGMPTAQLEDSDAWLSLVDRFGIVSERAVLLAPLTVVQNLAMPFSLDIEPPAADLRAKAAALAAEVGLPVETLDVPVADLDRSALLRIRLARALALDPAIALLEHPTAQVERPAVVPLARAIRQVAASRKLTALALTADEDFAYAFADRVLRLDAATGRLSERRRGWFTRSRF